MRIAPDRAIWKDFKEGRNRTLDSVVGCFKQLDVHRHNTAGIQAAFYSFKEFLCVEIRSALDPRIKRIHGDPIKSFGRCQKVVSTIIDPQLDLWVFHDTEILSAEVGCGSL